MKRSMKYPMKLYVDLGNSRTKWCLDNGDSSHYGVCLNGDWTALKAAVNHQPVNALTVIIAASVAGAEVEARFSQWCENSFKKSPTFARVEKTLVGVTTCYEDLSHLGVDRWLAMVAAYYEYKSACIVISAGTALTIDYISPDGRHLGGAIAPGLQMMRKALFSGTSQVKLESLTLPRTWMPGCDTVPCVNAGVAGAVEGLLAKALSHVPADCYSECNDSASGQPCQVFLTGGDRDVIAPWCGNQVLIREHLVLQGLKLWDRKD